MPKYTVTKKPQPAPAFDPRATHIQIESPALGIAKPCYVYQPPTPEGQRLPVLYLLRGHEREWINPHEDGSRQGTVIDVYERLRASGEIGPMLLVFPGMSSDDNAIPSFMMNMRAPELAAKHTGLGSGRFADFFFDDLLPAIDARFPTTGGRRAVAGFSLGGAMAVKAAALRPDLFACAAAYDGTFLYARNGGRTVKRADGVIANSMFDAAFGVPRDYAAIAANSPSNLILCGDAEALSRVQWFVGFGPRSAEPWQANYYRGQHLIRSLRARNLNNTFVPPAVPGGVHSWNVADTFIGAILPRLWQALQHEQ